MSNIRTHCYLFLFITMLS